MHFAIEWVPVLIISSDTSVGNMLQALDTNPLSFFFCSVFAVLGVCGADWYVAPSWGYDWETGCGNEPYFPCSSLYDVIHYGVESESEYVRILSDGEPAVIDICFPLDKRLSTSLYLFGDGQRPTMTCSGSSHQSILNINNIDDMFLFSLENIHFENSSIICGDANLLITNCSFRFTTLFLTGNDIVEILLGPNQDYHLDEYLYDTWVEEAELDVYSVGITVVDSYWFYHNLSVEDLRLDAFNRDSIVSFSYEFKGYFKNCVFNNQLIYLYSAESFEFHFINSSLSAPDPPPLVPGRIILHYSSSPLIFIKDSSFENLKFSDYAISLMYKQLVTEVGTLMFLVIFANQDRSVGFHFTASHIQIINCTFTENFRAIVYVSGDDKIVVNMKINDTFFGNNEIDYDGGAIAVYSLLSKIAMTITHCSFYDNKAGVRPFDTPISNLNVPIAHYGDLTILDYEFSTHDRTKLVIGTTSNNVTRRQVKDLRSSASGGALYLTNVHLRLYGCTFEGNSASEKGGSILLSKDALAVVNNTQFVTDSDDRRTVDGLVLTSYSRKFYGTGIDISVQTKMDKSTTIFSHLSGSEQGTIYLTSIKVTCPVNNQLNVETTSASVIDLTQNDEAKSQYLTYKNVKYSCQPCQAGHYMLEYGVYGIEQWTPNMTINRAVGIYENPDQTHVITDPNFQCHPCPWGGICNGTVKAKPNHWGTVKDNHIHFFKCPKSYCCSGNTCEGLNNCASHRAGTLCGRCKLGFSEAVFSVRCIDNVKCRGSWLIPFSILLAGAYGTFLLFQKDIKEFLFGKPTGRPTFLQTIKSLQLTKCEHITILNQGKGGGEKDGSGIFLILLFYYFQDASIIQFTPLYTKGDSSLVSSAKKVVGGLFKFRLDVLHLAKNVCAFSDLTPVLKATIKLLFVPALCGVLFAIYVIAQCISKRRDSSRLWQALSRRAVIALMLALLFSYQKLASTLFRLVYCVPVLDSKVLLMDGNIECFQHWQIYVIIYLATCIIPFSIYVAFMPAHFADGTLSTEAFFVGCLFPTPVILYCVYRKLYIRINSVPTRTNPNRHLDSVHKILQGPYRDLKIPLTNWPYCWSGILLGRRLLLILINTFIPDIVTAKVLMLAVTLISLLNHVIVQPCIERRANIAGTLSCIALMMVAIINMFRACFEGMETVPTGSSLLLSKWLDSVENCLLLWIPLVGIGIVILVLFFKTASTIVSMGSTRSSKLNKTIKVKPIRE